MRSGGNWGRGSRECETCNGEERGPLSDVGIDATALRQQRCREVNGAVKRNVHVTILDRREIEEEKQSYRCGAWTCASRAFTGGGVHEIGARISGSDRSVGAACDGTSGPCRASLARVERGRREVAAGIMHGGGAQHRCR